MSTVDVSGLDTDVKVSPTQMAKAFWEMHSDEQVEFFAELHRLAGDDLDMQVLWIMQEMIRMDNRDAITAFRTLHGWAGDFDLVHVDTLGWDARREIDRLSHRLLSAYERQKN